MSKKTAKNDSKKLRTENKTTTPPAATDRYLRSLSVTVYNGYAIVQGLYPVQLEQGANRFLVEGLPHNFDKTSLYLDAMSGPGHVNLGSTSYRPANLSPSSLLQESMNKRVCVHFGGMLPHEQQTIEGTLIAVTGTTVLLDIPDQGIREIRNVVGYTFPTMPEGLSATPSLSVTAEASTSGEYVSSMLYKALGLSWQADHKWIYDSRTGTMNWDGAILLNNDSGATFADAQIKVVAGNAGSEYVTAGAGRRMASMAGPESMSFAQTEPQSVGQVKVFNIPARNTIEQGECQKIPFFAATEVPVTREHRLRGAYAWWSTTEELSSTVDTILVVRNDTDHRLGTPLPSGQVSVMERTADGVLLKTGGGRMQDTAIGEKIALHSGTDFDLKAKRLVVHSERSEEQLPPSTTTPIQDGSPARPQKRVTTTRNCQIELFNSKDTAVDIVVEEEFVDNSKLQDGRGFTQVTASRYECTVHVEPGETATISYVVLHEQTDYLI